MRQKGDSISRTPFSEEKLTRILSVTQTDDAIGGRVVAKWESDEETVSTTKENHLVITEGEFKALALVEAGITANPKNGSGCCVRVRQI